jgi:hypothetical protein
VSSCAVRVTDRTPPPTLRKPGAPANGIAIVVRLGLVGPECKAHERGPLRSRMPLVDVAEVGGGRRVRSGTAANCLAAAVAARAPISIDCSGTARCSAPSWSPCPVRSWTSTEWSRTGRWRSRVGRHRVAALMCLNPRPHSRRFVGAVNCPRTQNRHLRNNTATLATHLDHLQQPDLQAKLCREWIARVRA